MFRNGLEPWHVILVVVVFVLLFGYKKLPDAARGLGKSLRILKSETRALRDEGKDGKESGATYTEKGSTPVAPEALDKGPVAEQAPVKDEQKTA
jgi:sec-independent protein translocase protein TatA